MLNALDTDGSGLIEYSEFVASASCREEHWQDDALQLAFRKFDLDGNGSISHAELKEIMRGADPGESSEALEMLATRARDECDEDGDGEIRFEEFRHLVCNLNDPIHN
jgi:calcium-dependent protein kinase